MNDQAKSSERHFVPLVRWTGGELLALRAWRLVRWTPDWERRKAVRPLWHIVEARGAHRLIGFGVTYTAGEDKATLRFDDEAAE